MRNWLRSKHTIYTCSPRLWFGCGRMIPPVCGAAPVLHGSEMTKHEACCLWHCADMFHSVRALQHIGTISHGPPTPAEASLNFRGSADRLHQSVKALRLRLPRLPSFGCYFPNEISEQTSAEQTLFRAYEFWALICSRCAVLNCVVPSCQRTRR